MYAINFEEPSIFAKTSFGKKKAAYKPRRSYTPRRSSTPRRSKTPRGSPFPKEFYPYENVYDPDRERMRREEKIKIAKLNASMTESERNDYWLRMSRFGNIKRDINYLHKLFS
jgi:hypothetical protein